MTYQVDLSKSGEELLLGLINYDNNPRNIPHQDLWPKVAILDGTNVVPGSKLIAPRAPWVVAENGSAVDMLIKKEIPFESNVCKVTVRGDDASRIFIDGVSYAGNNNKDHIATVEIPVEPGVRTVAVWCVNDEGSGGLTFTIHDGETLREVSDESWGFVTPIENGVVKEQYVKDGWRELTPDDILYVRPPVSVPDGSYTKTGTLVLAELGSPYGPLNCAYKRWPLADQYPFNPATETHYLKADPSAMYLYIADDAFPAKDKRHAFIKEVFCETGNVEFSGSFDDYAVLFVDGVQQQGEYNHLLSSNQFTVTPGHHKFAVVVREGPGGSPVHGNWAIKDGGKLVAVSNREWRAAPVGDAAFNNALAEVIVSIPKDYKNSFALESVNGTAPKEYVTTINNPDGSKTETHLIEMRGDDWSWTSKFNLINPPKNTITTVVTTDGEYDVKEVEVRYNRIGIDELFSLSGLSARENNLDVEEGGQIVLNQRVLDEINRRYGVNFTMADFELIYDHRGYTLKASPNSVAFNSETSFEIIRALTSRVPNTTLNGFAKENTSNG